MQNPYFALKKLSSTDFFFQAVAKAFPVAIVTFYDGSSHSNVVRAQFYDLIVKDRAEVFILLVQLCQILVP